MSGHVSSKTRTPNGAYVPLPPGLNECGVCDWDFSTPETRESHIRTRIAQEEPSHVNIFGENFNEEDI